MKEIIEVIFEHLVIWAFTFIVALAQIEDIKMAAECTVRFMILFYIFFGLFYIVIAEGGHISL